MGGNSGSLIGNEDGDRFYTGVVYVCLSSEWVLCVVDVWRQEGNAWPDICARESEAWMDCLFPQDGQDMVWSRYCSPITSDRTWLGQRVGVGWHHLLSCMLYALLIRHGYIWLCYSFSWVVNRGGRLFYVCCVYMIVVGRYFTSAPCLSILCTRSGFILTGVVIQEVWWAISMLFAQWYVYGL